MKNLLYLLLCVGIFSCQPDQVRLKVSNPLDIKRDGEILIVSRVFLDSIAGDLLKDGHPVLSINGEMTPQQLDDLDSDGAWDELVVLLNLEAKSSLNLELKMMDEDPEFEKRTDVHLGVDYERADNFVSVDQEKRHPDNHDPTIRPMMYQMEGPAWENEKVGFRNYFDGRNGKDIFGKRTAELVLQKTGTKGQDYHQLDDWGMDILKVGNSLGAGAVALSYKDSLIRLGSTKNTSFNILVEGPVRSIFELVHEDWNTPFGMVSVTERITIHAGKYGYKEEIITADLEDVGWVTGIVNKYSDSLLFSTAGNSIFMATYAKQSENKDYLGMGVIIPSEEYVSHGETAQEGHGITETYWVQMKSEKPSFLFIAGWELSDDQFKDKEGFVAYMREMSLRAGNPLKVK